MSSREDTEKTEVPDWIRDMKFCHRGFNGSEVFHCGHPRNPDVANRHRHPPNDLAWCPVCDLPKCPRCIEVAQLLQRAQ